MKYKILEWILKFGSLGFALVSSRYLPELWMEHQYSGFIGTLIFTILMLTITITCMVFDIWQLKEEFESHEIDAMRKYPSKLEAQYRTLLNDGGSSNSCGGGGGD